MSRFKTELCNNLIELGSCKYGDRCHYAHGAHELRQVSRRHPKYRTERCKNFELTGKCPFGPRCSYVHPKPDLDSMIEQLSKYMNHTKAPRPDSEDDDGMSFFTRNNTSVPTRDLNQLIDDENKENFDGVDYQQLSKGLTNHHLNRPTTFTDKNSTIRDIDSSKTSPTPLSVSKTSNISSRVNISSSTSRTPLGNHLNRSNILTPTNCLASDIKINKNSSNTHIDGICDSSNNLSLFEATSFETTKKSRIINTYPSNSSDTSSNPFGISNPFSDYLNSAGIKARDPVQPKKQFYTRF